MSALLISIILAASVGTWIYTKLARRSGYGNATNPAIAAGSAGFVIFIIVFSLLKLSGF